MKKIILGIGLCISLLQAQGIKPEAFGFKLGEKLDIKRNDLTLSIDETKSKLYLVKKKPIGNLTMFGVEVNALNQIYWLMGQGETTSKANCLIQSSELIDYIKEKYKIKGNGDSSYFTIKNNHKKILIGCQPKKRGYALKYEITDEKMKSNLNNTLKKYLTQQPKNTQKYKGL